MATPYKTTLSGFLRGTRIAGPLLNDVRRQNENRADLSGLSSGTEPEQVIDWVDFLRASDFDTTGDWTVTEVGTGSQAISTTAPNGTLVLTTGTSSGNSEAAQRKQATWCAGVQDAALWFRTRLKVDAAPTTVDVFAGLAIADTTPLTAAGRINFRVTSGSAVISCECNDGTTTHSVATPYSLVANTFVELSWRQTLGSVVFYVNNSQAAVITVNIPASTLPLAQTLMVKTDSAAARVMTVDSLLTAQDRNA